MNIKITAGLLLTGAAAPYDPEFGDAVILIAEYNKKGALGFVINQKFGRCFNELAEFSNSPAFPLYAGGPMVKESLFFIHRRPGIIEEGSIISNGLYLGGDFKQAVAGINAGELGENDIKIFIGYCGWDAGQLETELEQGEWKIAEEGVVF